MKIGDKVLIKDGSFAVKVSGMFTPERASIGLSKEEFEVVGFDTKYLRVKSQNGPVHDIFIKSSSTGTVYLHSESMLRVVTNYCDKCGHKL